MIWKKLMNGFFIVNKKASGLLSKRYGTGKGGNNQIARKISSSRPFSKYSHSVLF